MKNDYPMMGNPYVAVSAPDAEIETIGTIVRALDGLDKATTNRILHYLVDRFDA